MKEQKNENIIFLNLIYQNVEMGLLGIDTVLPKIKSENLAQHIEEQRKEYEHIGASAKEILLKYGAQEESIGKVKELSSKTMSEIMCMKADDQKIAKLMMEGNQKGVVEITEALNKYPDKDPEIIALAQKLLDTLEHNIIEFKKYL